MSTGEQPLCLRAKGAEDQDLSLPHLIHTAYHRPPPVRLDTQTSPGSPELQGLALTHLTESPFLSSPAPRWSQK